MRGQDVSALPGLTVIQSGSRTVGWLVPLRQASAERIVEAVRLVEEDMAARTPEQEAEIDAALRDHGIKWGGRDQAPVPHSFNPAAFAIQAVTKGEGTLKERQISKDDALVLCRRAEGHFFDHKAAAIAGAKLQKIVVAFANADGGEVVVGIAEDKDEPDPNKRWGGKATTEDFNGLLQAIHVLNPSVDVSYEFLKCDTWDTFALHIFVERSADVNKTADGKVYQRSGA